MKRPSFQNLQCGHIDRSYASWVQQLRADPTRVPEGSSMQAACYDPNVFPDPLRIDIHRNPRGIPIFGAGVHHCLGQVLARSMLQISLRMLMERFPRLALAQPSFQPKYHGEFGEALMVELPMTTA